jgi:beta-lactamase superfamily II metal-dependent hydrolase
VEPFTVDAEVHWVRWWKGKETYSDHRKYREAVYSTATNGDIVVTSDGHGYEVRYSGR